MSIYAPIVDTTASCVTMVWSNVGKLIFNMLVLVVSIKMWEQLDKDMGECRVTILMNRVVIDTLQAYTINSSTPFF